MSAKKQPRFREALCVERTVCCQVGHRRGASEPLVDDGGFIQFGAKVMPYLFPASDVTSLRVCDGLVLLNKVLVATVGREASRTQAAPRGAER